MTVMERVFHSSDIGLGTDAAQMPLSLPIGPMTSEWLGSNSTSNDLKRQWLEQGFSILSGAYPAEDIAAYNEIVAKVRPEVETGEDEYGYGDRIGQLHQRHPELLTLAHAPARYSISCAGRLTMNPSSSDR